MRGRAGINDPGYSNQKTISRSAKVRYVACAANTLPLKEGSRGLSVTRCG